MLTRPVTWVSPLADLHGGTALRRLGRAEGSVSEVEVAIRPRWVWDPSDTQLPIEFGTRTNCDNLVEVAVEQGFLDGHNWILDRDLTIFTSDIPGSPGLPVEQMLTAGMLTDRDTVILPTREGHSVWIEPRGTAHFADGIVAVSAEPSNWGSFLLRVLPKLVAAGQQDAPVLAYVAHSNQRLMAELAGVRPANLVHHETLLRYELRNVRFPVVPTSALWVSPRLKAVYLELAERARTRHAPLADHRKVYLSRRGTLGRASSRVLVNEAQLIDELERRGYHVVYPEDRPGPEVAAMVSGAELIVTLGGAGMFNVVFAQKDAVVIDIEGRVDWLYAHTNLLAGAVSRWGLFYGHPTDPTDRGVHRPWAVDIPSLLRALDEIG